MWKLAGKPLIEWALDACEHLAFCKIIVTTDSEAVKEIASPRALVIDRPWHLCSSSSLVVDAIEHAAWNPPGANRYADWDGYYEYGYVVQPTAPFVTADHFEAVQIRSGFKSGQTIIPVQHNAHWMNQRTMDGFVFKDRGQNSQGKPAAYQFGNLIYFTPESLAARNLYLEPSYKVEIPRWYGIDIDDEEDLKLAEAILDKGLVEL